LLNAAKKSGDVTLICVTSGTPISFRYIFQFHFGAVFSMPASSRR